MAVEDIRIVTSSEKEMSFAGELIAHATSDRSSGPLGDRWFDLRVYKKASEGFVPIINFYSTCDGEKDVTIAEHVDRSQDIENFYYVFEPYVVLPESVLQSMPLEERQRFTKTILKLYDAHVNRVLLSVKEHATDDDAEVEPANAEKKGLLGLFRQTV